MHFQLPVVHKALQLYFVIYFGIAAEIRSIAKFLLLSVSVIERKFINGVIKSEPIDIQD